MKAAALIALIASSAVVSAEFQPSPEAGIVRARLHTSHSRMRRAAMGKQYKRCKPRGSAPSESPVPTSPAPPPPAQTSPPATNPDPPAPAPPSGGGSGGVIKAKGNACGATGAVAKTSHDAGPNGSQDWLNCGINGGGWSPPMVTTDNMISKDLTEDLKKPNSIFKPCAQYSNIIYDAAGQYGLPPIMIASIMMQESTCNKDTVGGGGEQGLMQITHEKCVGAPGGNCKDPWFNIHTGAKYLSDQIKNSNGNVLLAVASYNGWFTGLTYDKATAAAHSNCCRCQQNLDYPHQFLNGWMQGIDAYSSNLGTYKNLDVCH
ncbi:hypothetical protein FRC12_008440 [Ceratobasidium sp. 428]|nr:hypothetical protein FRC12_008440 [Ceratobasidium sp. 428]